MNALPRRLAAALVAMALLALIACDQFVSGFPAWWDRHSLTGSIVSSLLVLAVTALIVDEVVALVDSAGSVRSRWPCKDSSCTARLVGCTTP